VRRNLILGFSLVALSCLGFAQTSLPRTSSLPDPAAEKEALEAKRERKAAGPDSPTACSYTFTTGSGPTYLQSCVTTSGNVQEFQSPAGIQNIYSNTEGYGFCDGNTQVRYYDWGPGYGDSGNWLAPVTLSHTATSVKIQRTTSDGVWTLTQTFTQSAPNVNLKVSMALKNNSAVARTAFLSRWVDVDAGGQTANSFDSTYPSVFGYVQSRYGLAMRTAPVVNVNTYVTTVAALDPCNFAPTLVAQPANGDYAILLAHLFPGIAKGATVTHTFTFNPL
jgi:hypothetical protein